MDIVFVVRHYYYVENVNNSEKMKDNPSLPSPAPAENDGDTSQKSKEIEKMVTVKEWIFRTYKSSHDHAVRVSLLLMGIERDEFIDLEEVRTFQEIYQRFELSEDNKKITIGVEVNYETGTETELIELEKMLVLD